MENNKFNERPIDKKENEIAQKIGNFLGEIRFLSKNKIKNNDHIKLLLQTKDALIEEINKSKSESLINVRQKGVKKEIFTLFETILTNSNEEDRNKLTKICMKWNLLDKQEREKETETIKIIIQNINTFSEKFSNKQIKERLDFFEQRIKKII